MADRQSVDNTAAGAHAGLDVQGPILIIGAGRSGTTLLARMLGSHPDICMRGETSFLASRLWREVATDRFHLRWRDFVATRPASASAPKPSATQEEEHRFFRIAGRGIARLIADSLDIDAEAKAWGYKEIWNGSSAHDHSWEPYDHIFPRAKWLHIIRHPLHFARSCAAWNGDVFDEIYTRKRLLDWRGIIRRSRERSHLGADRFFEMKYEDLLCDPRGCLVPALGSVHLPWHSNCLAAMDDRILASDNGNDPIGIPLHSIADDATGALAASLGYA